MTDFLYSELDGSKYISAIRVLSNVATKRNIIGTDISDLLYVWENKSIALFDEVLLSGDRNFKKTLSLYLDSPQKQNRNYSTCDSVVLAITLGEKIDFSLLENIHEDIDEVVINQKYDILIAVYIGRDINPLSVKFSFVGLTRERYE